MISIIIPINHKDRVGQANELYQRLKKDSGVDTQVIIAVDNPEIYDLVKGDEIYKIPKRIEFTQSVNRAARIAKYPFLWYMDDSVTPVTNWAKIALQAFTEVFPDGEGLLELSGITNCATRCIATKKCLYSLNMGYFLWPEYLHCGDAELFERTNPLEKFKTHPQVLLQETKINDESRKRNMKVFAFDDMIRAKRRVLGFPKEFLSTWEDLLKEYCKDDADLEELCTNVLTTI